MKERPPCPSSTPRCPCCWCCSIPTPSTTGPWAPSDRWAGRASRCTPSSSPRTARPPAPGTCTGRTPVRPGRSRTRRCCGPCARCPNGSRSPPSSSRWTTPVPSPWPGSPPGWLAASCCQNSPPGCPSRSPTRRRWPSAAAPPASPTPTPCGPAAPRRRPTRWRSWASRWSPSGAAPGCCRPPPGCAAPLLCAPGPRYGGCTNAPGRPAARCCSSARCPVVRVRTGSSTAASPGTRSVCWAARAARSAPGRRAPGSPPSAAGCPIRRSRRRPGGWPATSATRASSTWTSGWTRSPASTTCWTSTPGPAPSSGCSPTAPDWMSSAPCTWT